MCKVTEDGAVPGVVGPLRYDIALGCWYDRNGKFVREATEDEMAREDAVRNWGADE